MRQFARYELSDRLEALAEKHSIKINRISIKAQKTRWGSCSSKNNINLNYKLVFLPPEHMHYIMMHELAHTFHLNHSAQYWKTLSTLLPKARELDGTMREAAKAVPIWLENE